MRLILLFAFIFQNLVLYSQNIAGRVVDKNKNPIEGVLVYLDNTSIMTMTNVNGNFILENKNQLKTNIVFRLIGFKTVVTEFKPQMQVIMDKNVLDLEELVITKSKFTREQLLKAFKVQLLGNTDFGKKCKILNEADIILSYNVNNFTLEAISDKPIQVYNPMLGYNIAFDLVKFATTYNNYSIDAINYIKNEFYGTTLFKEVNLVNEVMIKNREKTYKGSAVNFFYELTHNIQDKKTFQIFRGSLPSTFQNCFEIFIQDDGSFIVNPKQNPNTTSKFKNIQYKFNLLYNGKKQSAIHFKTDQVFVDKLGDFSPVDHIIFSGEMSKKRLGDMLPLTYVFKYDAN